MKGILWSGKDLSSEELMEWNQRVFVTIVKPLYAQGGQRKTRECQIKSKELTMEYKQATCLLMSRQNNYMNKMRVWLFCFVHIKA